MPSLASARRPRVALVTAGLAMAGFVVSFVLPNEHGDVAWESRASAQCHRGCMPDEFDDRGCCPAPVRPSDARDPDAPPPGMVRIPGGSFDMGAADGQPLARPVHRVTLPDFYIDRTEVTVAAYGECTRDEACLVARADVDWFGGRERDRRGESRYCNGLATGRHDHPMNCISWNAAQDYCHWRGKRLPTEAEWEFAARGSAGRTFPWGNQAPDETRGNFCDRDCRTQAARYRAPRPHEPMSWSDGFGGTAPVGQFPQGATPEGVLDMAGNVWEWTADREGRYHAAPSVRPTGPRLGPYRVMRGGSFYNSSVDYLRGTRRGGGAPANRLHDLGFRCARDV